MASLWVVAVLFGSHGCASPNSLDRLPITGTVIPEQIAEGFEGSIIFKPKGKGPSAATSIINGKYQFDKQNGPIAGVYQVIVNRHPKMEKLDGLQLKRDVKSPPSQWTFEVTVTRESLDLEPLVLNEESVVKK